MTPHVSQRDFGPASSDAFMASHDVTWRLSSSEHFTQSPSNIREKAIEICLTVTVSYGDFSRQRGGDASSPPSWLGPRQTLLSLLEGAGIQRNPSNSRFFQFTTQNWVGAQKARPASIFSAIHPLKADETR
jgi:hypothetical protein